VSAAGTQPRTERRALHQVISIETASSWVLRTGVVLSVVVMVAGLVLGLARGGVTVYEMEHRGFSGHPATLWRGVTTGSGFAVMEVGLLILVLTPIVRVGTAMLLFAIEDHDWTYTLVTAAVLAMTLSALLLLR
jgi:uncharacterized membrane protein